MQSVARLYDSAFPLLVLLHLIVAPYTKVEESFNIQAIHDIIKYGIPTTNGKLRLQALFDHMTYSGAVPRTFIGAIVTAGISRPLALIYGLDGLILQTIARASLGILNAAALIAFVHSIRKAYGTRTALWYTAFQASQFHVFYYASRTLPNMFAFCLSTFAHGSFLRDLSTPTSSHLKQLRRAFFLLTFAAVIFRSEIALLIAAHSGWLLVKFGSVSSIYATTLMRRVIVPAVFSAGVASIIISVPIDTYLWQSDHFFLPELTSFWFNIFPKNHQGASAWGTSPWHWYFTSAIPRLVFSPTLSLLPYGVLFSARSLAILDNLIPPLVYTIIYSILPHKETRFLFPIIPSITLATAISASTFSLRRDQLSKFLTTILAISTVIYGITSHAILLPLSAQSYPGGHALTALHEYHNSIRSTLPAITASKPSVHLSNLALQSGVTRFTEKQVIPFNATTTGALPPPKWTYEKTEKTNSSDTAFWTQFDYVVIEPWQVNNSVLDTSRWTKVASIPALRKSRPRVMRSLEKRECLVLACGDGKKGNDGLYELFTAMYGSDVAWVYGAVHDVLREGYGVGGRSLTNGYWFDWGLEERLVILKQQQQQQQQQHQREEVRKDGWVEIHKDNFL